MARLRRLVILSAVGAALAAYRKKRLDENERRIGASPSAERGG